MELKDPMVMEFIFQAGISCPLHIEMVLNGLVDYHCIIKSEGMADQFIHSLGAEIHEIIKMYPSHMKRFFVYQQSKCTAGNIPFKLYMTSQRLSA